MLLLPPFFPRRLAFQKRFSVGVGMRDDTDEMFAGKIKQSNLCTARNPNIGAFVDNWSLFIGCIILYKLKLLHKKRSRCASGRYSEVVVIIGCALHVPPFYKEDDKKIATILLSLKSMHRIEIILRTKLRNCCLAHYITFEIFSQKLCF